MRGSRQTPSNHMFLRSSWAQRRVNPGSVSTRMLPTPTSCKSQSKSFFLVSIPRRWCLSPRGQLSSMKSRRASLSAPASSSPAIFRRLSMSSADNHLSASRSNNTSRRRQVTWARVRRRNMIMLESVRSRYRQWQTQTLIWNGSWGLGSIRSRLTAHNRMKRWRLITRSHLRSTLTQRTSWTTSQSRSVMTSQLRTSKEKFSRFHSHFGSQRCFLNKTNARRSVDYHPKTLYSFRRGEGRSPRKAIFECSVSLVARS